ncbi:MAG: YlmC/YmxH family sporulation protein [Oscillospiraceae bacterium]|jgi:YlmC/YmxH family sporulation protein|nr:YlmC/YmxH family sporulation protein [Oscillospiraceae bacterium]
MICNLSDLRNKEVINITDGTKIGFVDDIEMDTEKCCIVALIVYGRERLFGFFGREEDTIIPFSKISLIGSDTILVFS